MVSKIKVDEIESSQAGGSIAYNSSLKLKQYNETQIDALSGMSDGEMVYDTTNKSIRIYNSSSTEWKQVEGSSSKSVTGGTITTSGSYTIHTFNSSDAFQVNGFTVQSPLAVEYLVFAGGAGGFDAALAAGGGAGSGSNQQDNLQGGSGVVIIRYLTSAI